MSKCHHYWHIYPQTQIKHGLHGGLVCVLEVPWRASKPVVRCVLDPAGLDFPGQKALTFPSLLSPDHHGVMYVGVSKTAVCDLMLTDPPMMADQPDYTLYNRQIISRARNFFLVDPNRGFKAMPQHMVQLL